MGPHLIVLKDSSCWGLGHIYGVGMEPESTKTTRASPLDLTLLNLAPDTTFSWETHLVSPSQSLNMIHTNGASVSGLHILLLHWPA